MCYRDRSSSRRMTSFPLKASAGLGQEEPDRGLPLARDFGTEVEIELVTVGNQLAALGQRPMRNRRGCAFSVTAVSW